MLFGCPASNDDMQFLLHFLLHEFAECVLLENARRADFFHHNLNWFKVFFVRMARKCPSSGLKYNTFSKEEDPLN